MNHKLSNQNQLKLTSTAQAPKSPQVASINLGTMDFLIEHLKGFGTLFYLVNPYETMYETVDDLPHPNWTASAHKYFVVLILLELVILRVKGAPYRARFNDMFSSLANGIITTMLAHFVMKGLRYAGYQYIYNNYGIYTLPWDSIWTWLLGAIAYDLGHYWIHRAQHEVNLIWATHQVHHSSEDFNLSTALRISVFQEMGSWLMSLPLALFVPPAYIIMHSQLNLLFQFSIHTELVQDLGPLEYVFNTAKHHRVHHGSNRYCLDKNYACVLIIWDRMFGTFAWEREDEKIVYGLVEQPQFFNPLKHQLFYFGKIIEKACSMENWLDRLSAVFKGPGWFPGTGRLGDYTMVPEQPDRIIYDPKVPLWVQFYCILNLFFAFLAMDCFAEFYIKMSQVCTVTVVGFIIWTIFSIALIFDKNRFAWTSEICRGMTLLMTTQYFGAWTYFWIPTEILNSMFIILVIISACKINFAWNPEEEKSQIKTRIFGN